MSFFIILRPKKFFLLFEKHFQRGIVEVLGLRLCLSDTVLDIQVYHVAGRSSTKLSSCKFYAWRAERLTDKLETSGSNPGMSHLVMEFDPMSDGSLTYSLIVQVTTLSSPKLESMWLDKNADLFRKSINQVSCYNYYYHYYGDSVLDLPHVRIARCF